MHFGSSRPNRSVDFAILSICILLEVALVVASVLLSTYTKTHRIAVDFPESLSDNNYVQLY